jgi:hypothetical protein
LCENRSVDFRSGAISKTFARILLSELERLNRGDFRPEEIVNRPCTEEEVEMLREMGRLDNAESSDNPDKSESGDKPK